MAKITREDILAYLEEATILDLNELVKAIEEMRKISNHHITSSEFLDIIKGPFRKIDVAFMEVSTIGYSNIGCSIVSDPFVI